MNAGAEEEMRQTARKRLPDERMKRSQPPAQTALGKRLRAIREKLTATGERLLDWDGIEKEIADRRGES